MMSTDKRYREAGLRPPRGSDAFPSEAWTVAELRAYAEKHEIDLTDARVKPDILAAVTAPAVPTTTIPEAHHE